MAWSLFGLAELELGPGRAGGSPGPSAPARRAARRDRLRRRRPLTRPRARRRPDADRAHRGGRAAGVAVPAARGGEGAALGAGQGGSRRRPGRAGRRPRRATSARHSSSTHSPSTRSSIARTQLAYGVPTPAARRRADARAPPAGVPLDLRRARRGALGDTWPPPSSRPPARPRSARRPEHVDDLTPQERQIAQLLADGRTTRQAAAALFLSPKTIEYHLRHVYTKLGVASRVELAEAMDGEVK